MTNTCYMVNGYHGPLRCHRSIERNQSFCDFCVSYLVSTEFSKGTDVDVEQDFVKMSDIELPDNNPVVWERILCYLQRTGYRTVVR